MSLKEQIQTDANAALRAADKPRLGALRLILAAIKQQEVDTRTTLDDATIHGLLGKMIKKGRDAAAQFEAAGRDDLASKEAAEVACFESYLPAQLEAAELEALVADVIAQTGAQSPQDMGKVMAAVKSAVAGRADMGAVSALVKAALANS
jgi:uncharacterized protein YqeY